MIGKYALKKHTCTKTDMSNYQKYSAAERKAWGKKMALARAAKQAQMNMIAPGIYTGSGAYVQRQYPKVYGSGAYNYGRAARNVYRFAKKVIPKGTGRAVGTALGAQFGNPQLGASIGGAVSKAIGVGSYSIKENSLFAGGIPTVISSNGKGFIVRHREYLQNIVTAADASFTIQSFPLQPGLSSVFPWLSQVAVGFEEYKIRGMIWEFKSTSSDSLSSTTTSLGTVIMATQYDSSRPAFQNQQQMANHEFANSCKPSENMMHAIECARSQTVLGELWVRTGAVPQNDDERFYDFGTFQIATVGGPSVANTIGELWVSYEVEFFKPQLITGLGLNLLTDHWWSTTGVSTSNYFGSDYANAMNTGSNLGCTLSADTISFPSGLSEGTFLICYSVTGSSTSVVAPGQTLTNCTAVNLFFSNDQTGASTNSNNGATYTKMMFQLVVKVNAQGATVRFSGATLPTSATNMDLIITQINGGTN